MLHLILFLFLSLNDLPPPLLLPAFLYKCFYNVITLVTEHGSETRFCSSQEEENETAVSASCKIIDALAKRYYQNTYSQQSQQRKALALAPLHPPYKTLECISLW